MKHIKNGYSYDNNFINIQFISNEECMIIAFPFYNSMHTDSATNTRWTCRALKPLLPSCNCCYIPAGGVQGLIAASVHRLTNNHCL